MGASHGLCHNLAINGNEVFAATDAVKVATLCCSNTFEPKPGTRNRAYSKMGREWRDFNWRSLPTRLIKSEYTNFASSDDAVQVTTVDPTPSQTTSRNALPNNKECG